MLITVKNKKLLSMPMLTRLALRFVYEEEKMSLIDIRLMQENIVWWANAIKIEKEKQDILSGGLMHTDHELLEEEMQLERIAKVLEDNKNGKMEERKAMFKEHNIDWRKFHRLSEAYEEKDFIQAQEYWDGLPEEDK